MACPLASLTMPVQAFCCYTDSIFCTLAVVAMWAASGIGAPIASSNMLMIFRCFIMQLI